MNKPPLIKTENKVMSLVVSNTDKEYKREVKYFERVIGRIVKGNTEKLLVLTIILRELMKLKKGKKIGFDFGTKKEFELRRKK